MQYDQFYLFCQQEQWLQQPMTAPLDSNPTLSIWQRWQRRQALSSQDLAFLPLAAAHVYQGWQCYNLGSYIEAHDYFNRCVADECHSPVPAIVIDASLGLCRIYTRIGHWHSARLWAIHALQLSRKFDRLFDISRSFNALGDLLCRAGQPQLAHVCLVSSAEIMPQGSVHRPRHLNSIATTLMRQHAYDRAESALMTSLFLARDHQDHSSVWHALARLQFIYLARDETIKVTERFAELLPASKTPIACAYILLAEAVLALKQQQSATELLQQAGQLLGSQFPVETAWLARLLQQESTSPAFLEIVANPVNSIDYIAVFDRCWLSFPLADQQMNWLQQPTTQLTSERILQERLFLFI